MRRVRQSRSRVAGLRRDFWQDGDSVICEISADEKRYKGGFMVEAVYNTGKWLEKEAEKGADKLQRELTARGITKGNVVLADPISYITDIKGNTLRVMGIFVVLGVDDDTMDDVLDILNGFWR